MKSPAIKASTNYKKQHRTFQSLRKNWNNSFFHTYQEHFHKRKLVIFQLKNILVNDGDIKEIANKF